MRRRFPSTWAVLILVIALLLAGAACGGDESSSGSSPAADAGLSADEIVKQSEAKMQDVKSASFTADMSLKVQGDPAKMTDPTAQALLSDGITMRAEGASSSEPQAVDMKLNVGMAGQSIDLGIMSEGVKTWVEYKGTWYAADKKSAKSLDEQLETGAAPTEQMKSLGLDPSTWGTTYAMVGNEDLGGVKVYHIKATTDPQKMAAALIDALNDPSLSKKLGGGDQTDALEQGLTQDKQQLEQFQKSLKDVSLDYWIGVDDLLIYKADAAATLDTKGQKDMEGVDAMVFGMTLTLSDFDQPVTVTPPAKAENIDKLMNEIMGGVTLGT